jgi:hypothetical protein
LHSASEIAELQQSGRVLFNMLDSSIFPNKVEAEFFNITICFPALLILLILAYVIIKEWAKRLK